MDFDERQLKRNDNDSRFVDQRADYMENLKILFLSRSLWLYDFILNDICFMDLLRKTFLSSVFLYYASIVQEKLIFCLPPFEQKIHEKGKKKWERKVLIVLVCENLTNTNKQAFD